MANPTTNYGFVLPTSTDLVTDLPADFDVALQGVDTRLKALQPGTTLGDIAYSSATANTNTRLAIGSTGNVLTVAAGVPSWSAPAVGSRGLNEIIPSSVSVGSGTATVGANGKITFTTVGTNLSINGVFSSTYTNYKMVMDYDDSANNSATIRLRVGGTDNTTASSYVSQVLQAQSTTVSTARHTQSYWNDPFFSNSNATNAVELNFYRPFLADTTAFSSLAESSASGAHLFVACGTHNQNTSYDGFSLVFFSANTFTGGLTIYGWNE